MSEDSVVKQLRARAARSHRLGKLLRELDQPRHSDVHGLEPRTGGGNSSATSATRGRAGVESLYVSKFPPSSSGIGLYASVFERVLAGLGPVGRVTAPSEPEASQRFRSFVSGVLKGASARTSRADLV